MALVLNGSGSITGLSAGGLPDGSVTADDIASLPAGSVLQVVQGSTSTETSTNSTSYVDTILTASITPSSAANKILVLVSAAFYYERNTDSMEMNVRIVRGASVVQEFQRISIIRATKYSNLLGMGFQGFLQKLDSPSTTSSTTYTLQIKADDASSSTRINKDNQGTSIITLMEIAA